MDPAAGIVLGIGLLVISGVTQVIRAQAANGDLERNAAMGIRTRATMSSDAAWRAGHRAAVPWLHAATISGCAAAAVSIVSSALLLATADESAGPMVVALLGWVAVLTILLVAVREADSAARSVDDRG
jgi:SdpI/YhfL family protein